jgi:hypothetical protein
MTDAERIEAIRARCEKFASDEDCYVCEECYECDAMALADETAFLLDLLAARDGEIERLKKGE